MDKNLTCYGCGHCVGCAKFPGEPSGERPCAFCIRNPKREVQLAEDKKMSPESYIHKPGEPNFNAFEGRWYDGSPAIKVPMDCYQPIDMMEQSSAWEDQQEKGVCYFCGEPRTGKWALMFGMPDTKGRVEKRHICPKCEYRTLKQHGKLK